MLIRTSSDARPTRRAYVLGTLMIVVALALWVVQQTPLAPLAPDADSTLLGMACGLAFGLAVFAILNDRDEEEG